MSSSVTPGKAMMATRRGRACSPRLIRRGLADFEGILSFKLFCPRLYSLRWTAGSFAVSRNLGSQYRTIRSPSADYAVHSFPDASRISLSDRPSLMDAMNGIIAINWKAMQPHWTVESSPFEPKYSLILVYDVAGLVAFSVYRVMRIAGRLAIYRSGTEVLPAHQGRGLYGFFASEVLKCSGANENGDRGVLYGWRTRNPIVWAANAKICEKVTPSLLDDAQDPVLQAACVEMCAS